MRKNKDVLKKRRALAQLAVNEPKKAAKYFELAALSLYQCNNTNQSIDVLSRVLFLSTKTIEKDVYKDSI